MYRRTALATGATILTSGVVGSAVVAQENDDDDDNGEDDDDDADLPDDMETAEFSGEGVEIVNDLEIEGGLTIIEGSQEEAASILVQAIPADDGPEFTVVGNGPEFVGGAMLAEGEYDIYVDAEDEWELTVVQPQTADEEPEEIPASLEGEGPDWAGPIDLEAASSVTGSHDGAADFEVEIFTEDGTELVFHVVGEFEGETSIAGDGDGYAVIDADGEWELEIE